MKLETDYLVVGAGASGMAFVDALIEHSSADVIMVDRRHRPGGHWHDAYPFVRLHQPAACYGVSSTDLGGDRIDTRGNNAGMYELSSAHEICSYFSEVMERGLLPSGQVRYLPMSEYRRDEDGRHVVSSVVNGEQVEIIVRRKVVDAAYIEPAIPSTHTPAFDIDPGAVVIPPNDLVKLRSRPSGYVVLGAGKTAMDTCTWLLENGVAQDSITWVRSRDVWSINRSWTQCLDLVEARARFGAAWLEAAAVSKSGAEMALKLEEMGVFLRIDRDVAPTAFRGATISEQEIEGLRNIANIVRSGRVTRVRADGLDMVEGSLDLAAGHVVVDCTATGLRTLERRRVFEKDQITLQYVTPGFACWSAATLAVVEALIDDDDDVKERLALPVVYTGHVDDLLSFTRDQIISARRRGEVPEIRAWSGRTRLNPARGLRERLSDPAVKAAMDATRSWAEPAMENIIRRVGPVADLV
ncbi:MULTISPECIES: NAD(P)-binding protein [unclassified Aeromicrobium]|uniref:NAD(P)-binding protein n=1 Tax=unclassified Aeromicrobium TaxID=2633570 RepID=UPI00288947FF|nr:MULTISPECIES: NAD(P)-binding protein [unclassified Aeromicrobium]